LKNPAVPCSVLIPGGSWWPSHYKRLIPTPGVDPFSTGPCVKADSFWVLIPGEVGQAFRDRPSDLMSATHSKMQSATLRGGDRSTAGERSGPSRVLRGEPDVSQESVDATYPRDPAGASHGDVVSDQPFHSSRSHPASLLHELAREHHRCGIGRTSSPFLHLVPGLKRELGHHA
jgi:hypothetical protein